MRRSIVGFHRAASKSLAHTTTNTTRDKSFTENTGFLLFVFAVVRVFFFFFFFFFEYAKGGGIQRVVGDCIEIIVVGRTLRFAKRRRDKRERQLFAFHRNNTNEQW